jgi:hypothetical protein
MADNQKTGSLRLWISYPWISKEEMDFRCLVSQLKSENIEAVYDSFELLPDMRFWERTAQRLLSVGFDGWLYVLTHQCITRTRCADELAEAVNQSITRLGREFPMAGLLYGLSIQQVPPSLRMRPCIPFGGADWKKQVSGALRHGQAAAREVRQETSFVWTIHRNYGDDPSLTAVEVRPKDDVLQYWRFAIPKSAQAARWGQGPPGGREISPIRFAEASGSGRYGKNDVCWFGAANSISNTESAYAVFSGALPQFICFGEASTPFGPPRHMEIFWTALSGKSTLLR